METDPHLTTGDWLDEWLALLHTRVRRTTHATYRRTADAYLRPHIGSIPLIELGDGTVARWARRGAARQNTMVSLSD